MVDCVLAGIFGHRPIVSGRLLNCWLRPSIAVPFMRIPPIVIVIVILIFFPRHRVAEKVGYFAMRCILAVAVLIPIIRALLK